MNSQGSGDELPYGRGSLEEELAFVEWRVMLDEPEKQKDKFYERLKKKILKECQALLDNNDPAVENHPAYDSLDKECVEYAAKYAAKDYELTEEDRKEIAENAKIKGAEKAARFQSYLKTYWAMTPSEIEHVLLNGEIVDNDDESIKIDLKDEDKYIVKLGDIRIRANIKFSLQEGEDQDNGLNAGSPLHAGRGGYAAWKFAQRLGLDIIPIIVERKIGDRHYQFMLRHEESLSEEENHSKVEQESGVSPWTENHRPNPKFYKHLAHSRTDLETLRVLDFVLGNWDRYDLNMRTRPGKRVIGNDEDYGFLACGKTNYKFPVGYAYGQEGKLLAQTKALIKRINKKMIAEVGKQANLPQLNVIYAMLRYERLRKDPDIIEIPKNLEDPFETSYPIFGPMTAASKDLHKLYNGDLKEEIEEIMKGLDYPGSLPTKDEVKASSECPTWLPGSYED
jgi:hypothetical protein